MIRQLKLKPDFQDTIQRFDAWWNLANDDRPLASISVEPAPYRGPVKQHATIRDAWLDVEYQVEKNIAELERHVFPGESFPCWMPNIGPELTSTPWGCELEFSDRTSWSIPFIESIEQWHDVLNREPDWHNVYWSTIEKMTDLALEMNDGRYVVAIADLHGNMDILAGLRDPQLLLMDLMDDPDLIGRACHHCARSLIEGFGRLYNKVAAHGFGSVTWVRMYHEGPAYVPSSDFWCMVNNEQAREIVLPVIRKEIEPLERSLFHLDGPDALRHLDLLLELPELTGVQWVYGAGNGPASKWIDVFRRCLEAGKCIEVQCSGDADDTLKIVDALGARGVWLSNAGHFKTEADARAYLQELERRSRATPSIAATR